MQLRKDNLLTVSELNLQLKKLLDNFPEFYVVGEISNFKKDASGHWYFTLKDEQSQISCKMWRGINSSVKFAPSDGLQVVVRGKLSVYVPYGNYSLIVSEMERYGIGILFEQFEKLKAKLAAEGLFDKSRKREIPKFPQKIGIVTSATGAALRDMIKVASKRYPIIELLIVNSKVQGEGAKESIANAFEILNHRDDLDLIIVGRGGGSIEDLWAFNEEIVARAIAASKFPVISAVGHETDYTIADFVADLRAPTPSAAMEIALPDKNEILNAIYKKLVIIYRQVYGLFDLRIQGYNSILFSHGLKAITNLFEKKYNNLITIINKQNYLIDNIYNSRYLKLRKVNVSRLEILLNQNRMRLKNNFEKLNIAEQHIDKKKDKLDKLTEKFKFQLLNLQDKITYFRDKNHNLFNSINNKIMQQYSNGTSKLEILKHKLHKFDQEKILAMGYAIVKKDNSVIISSKELNKNDNVNVIFYDGNTEMIVK